MSDVREALRTLRENIRQEGRTVQQIGIRDNDDTRNAIAVLLDNEAALQQTAPAVPEKREWNQCCGRDDFKFTEGWNACRKAMLTAAPAPDHSPDAGKVAFVDGVGAQRMLAEECKEGIEYIIHGDNIYWPLSDDDELRLIQAACGNGEFTYPGTPAQSVEEIQALEAFAHDCGLFDSAYDDQEHIEIPRWRFKEYIARLRASQQEGGDV